MISESERERSDIPAPGRFAGILELAGQTRVAGWAANLEDPAKAVSVELVFDGKVEARVKADIERPDLVDRLGDAASGCGFEYRVPRRLKDGRYHVVSARISGNAQELAQSPRMILCPFDVSEPLPVNRLQAARQETLDAVDRGDTDGLAWSPPPMNIHLVCYEDLDDWILGKITRKLKTELETLGLRVSIGKCPDPAADLNHHIIYWGYVDRKRTPETVMITHIENQRELGKVRQQLVELGVEMGICMSLESVNRLAAMGIPRHQLCFVSPAHDARIRPRKLNLGITSRLYPDGCKREHLLMEAAARLPAEHIRFSIMGGGWESVIQTLERNGLEVAYFPEFELEAYENLIRRLDYYLYLGTDEGSLGFLDAVAAAVPTIVTPQGFHLDVPGGITHAIEDAQDLVRVIIEITAPRVKRSSSVAHWTWREFALRHALVWSCVLSKSRGQAIDEPTRQACASIGLEGDGR